MAGIGIFSTLKQLHYMYGHYAYACIGFTGIVSFTCYYFGSKREEQKKLSHENQNKSSESK